MLNLQLQAKCKYLLNGCPSKKIFVIGTGRSGTHWIGYTIASHPAVRATVEEQPIFGWVKEMALRPSTRERLMPKLIRRYKWHHFQTVPNHYLDKSHPNIWLAEYLAEAFEEGVFIGMLRNPFAVVNSMLQHEGVLKWHRCWREFPIPNPFLGITEENASAYEALPIAAKCALRWRAHKERMEELEQILGSRLKVVRYESFVEDPEQQVRNLQHFIGLDAPIPVPKAKRNSIDKWKCELDYEEKKQIKKVVKEI